MYKPLHTVWIQARNYSGMGLLGEINPNSLWWVHMGISLKERQITEEPMKVKIWKKIANLQAFSTE